MVERRLCSSRERAKSAITAGLVCVNGQQECKPSRDVSERDVLDLREDEALRYVSRGALKLLRALDEFAIDVAGQRCLDVGASTGGFTQVLLERGAAQVTAVDVGTAQLAQIIRDDTRVLSLEQTDIRTLETAPVAFACVDVSFISLRLVLPKLFELVVDGGCAICLVKPQFELGPGAGKHGVIKDPKAQRRALEEVTAAAERVGFMLGGTTVSPITGGAGNVEFLLCLKKEVAR